jgi:hypothetical protein
MHGAAGHLDEGTAFRDESESPGHAALQVKIPAKPEGIP